MKTKHSRQSQQMNSGSMADIAFLLLIFFLVTTSIVNDKGITLLLPPESSDDKPPVKTHDKNMFSILVNSEDQLMVEGELRASTNGLREEIKKFVLNYGHNPNMSESPLKAIVSIQTNRGTSQKAFIEVLDESKAAYYEIYAKDAGMTTEAYRKLNGSDPRFRKLRKSIPMNISIAEPNGS